MKPIKQHEENKKKVSIHKRLIRGAPRKQEVTHERKKTHTQRRIISIYISFYDITITSSCKQQAAGSASRPFHTDC